MERRGERTALIVRVVRGEAPLTALATVGIVPHFEGNRLTFENPHRLEAPIAIQDLATGLLAEHHEPGYRSEAAYRRWAFTMMAWEYADFPFDDAAADDPLSVENFVRGVLWDASFGNPIGDETRRALATVADGTPSTG